MPKIGRQLRQQLLEVCAGAIPSDHPMNGCGVSNIVDARLVNVIGVWVVESPCPDLSLRETEKSSALPELALTSDYRSDPAYHGVSREWSP